MTKAVGRETFRTVGSILTDIAENKSPEVCLNYIVSEHLTESVQNLIGNLRGGGRKLARGDISVTKKRKKAKRTGVIKGTSPGLLQSPVIMSRAVVASVSSEFDIFMHRPIKTAVLGTVDTCINPSPPWNRRI